MDKTRNILYTPQVFIKGHDLQTLYCLKMKTMTKTMTKRLDTFAAGAFNLNQQITHVLAIA